MSFETTSNGNAIVIYGGGLVDPAKFVLMSMAEALAQRKLYSKVFIGQYSFESLYKRNFWFEYSEELQEQMKHKRGTVFGTCRGVDLSVEPLKSQAIALLKAEEITTIVICGGDGSARNAAEMEGFFTQNGITVVFGMPLTIDGINGGKVIGRRQAKRESVRQTENLASTALRTRDAEKYSVCMVELQGRNRDDILARVLEHFVTTDQVADFRLEDILLLAIPATIESDIEGLVKEVKTSEKRTLILISEGADIPIDELSHLIEKYGEPKRKVRPLTVGHPSQSNNQTTEEDETEYMEWINFVADAIKDFPGQAFSTSLSEDGEYAIQAIDYYAKLNPRNGQRVQLPETEINLIKRYMVLPKK